MGHPPNLRGFNQPQVYGRVPAVAEPDAQVSPQTSDEMIPLPSAQTASGPVVEVDHAVFTSMRSPTGEGYRIVAASSSIRPNEKTEITRRCPSHGALCRVDADASGLMGFPLPTERFCIAYSVYAGTEHTARGGQRVYTHVVLLDTPTYRRFGCNPLLVRAALRSVLGDTLDPKPPAVLDPLPLPLPKTVDGLATVPPRISADRTTDQLTNMLAHVVSDCRTVVAGVESALSVLELMVTAMPASMREGLSFSIGVKFAPSRQTHFALVDPDDGETQRMLRGQTIQYVEMGSIPAGKAAEVRGWLGLVQRWWSERRYEDLVRLTNRLSREIPTGTLGWIATICNDIDRIVGAERPVLDDLAAKYNGFMADDPVESELVQRLLARLEEERAKHEEEHEAEGSDPNSGAAGEHVTSGRGIRIRG